MVDSVVIGVDGSPGADAAAEWAVRFVCSQRKLGRRCDATLLSAWHPPAIDTQAVFDDAPFRDSAVAALERTMSSLPEGIDFGAIVRRGYPSDVLLSYADSTDADLIVVGSRGRSALAQVLLGSVSRSVAARAGRPVAVIPTTDSDTGTAGTATTGGITEDTIDRPVVVGYDDSPGSRAAIRWALDNFEGPIVALAAWVLPSTAIYDPLDVDVEQYRLDTEKRLMEGLAELCGGSIDRRVTPKVQFHDPRTALTDPANNASAVVLGARSRSGVRGLLLGSTVTYVACHTKVPLIVVPPEEDHDDPSDSDPETRPDAQSDEDRD